MKIFVKRRIIALQKKVIMMIAPVSHAGRMKFTVSFKSKTSETSLGFFILTGEGRRIKIVRSEFFPVPPGLPENIRLFDIYSTLVKKMIDLVIRIIRKSVGTIMGITN